MPSSESVAISPQRREQQTIQASKDPAGDGGDKKRTFSKDDFEFHEQLGAGAYSQVFLTTFKPTGKKYATKVIQKQLILRENKIRTVKMEKQVLHMMHHANIIELFCTYQDKENLYFALELAPGGEMFTYLNKYGPFSMDAAVFYTAEIVNGMEYMHGLGIIHRDMKPENIIFTKDMHAKITDFGTAKIKGIVSEGENDDLMKRKHKQTFCGTAEYVSPEILKGDPCTEGSDLWALGCIIFQLLTGRHPFKAESEYLIFQKILKRELVFPPGFPEAARDIVDKLLQLPPEQRLGMGSMGGYKALKSHPFFNNIDFSTLLHQSPPPLVPQKKEEPDTRPMSPVDAPQSPSQLLKQESFRQFLLKGESIIFLSQIVKRRKLSAKKRTLILTDRPRLIYVDLKAGAIKGQIPWSKELRCVKKTDKDFTIQTPGRDYILEDLAGAADEWIKAIDALQKRL